ncbi:hypothetical protein [Streptomyces massasporeus]|uniref:hypothetical protein n=1 Tax=Streptomyces massasporeus TaxID=67324 RepID=UPI001671BC67|nr:hypothetical protein [Streptomyces massasporeus]GGV91600.1 hypothetical protein GCM10010228_82380 [Streptomyces massasporeus]
MADENTSDATETESATDTGHQDDAATALGEGGQKALAAERKARAAAEKTAAATTKERDRLAARLQELEDRDKTEAQKLAEAKAAAESEAATAKQELLRYRVAAKKKLPAELAARLRGATEEEMETDADSLLEVLGQRQTPSYDGGVRKPAAAPTDMNALIRSKAGFGG